MVDPKQPGDVLHYVSSFRTKLQSAGEAARKHLFASKVRMKVRYDRKAVVRQFDPGDVVLVLNSGPKGPLGLGFVGPYRVLKRVGNLNYIVSTPDRRLKTRLCHVNALKAYESPVATVCCAMPAQADESEVENCEELSVSTPEVVSARLCNTEARAVLKEQLVHLTKPQRRQILHLVDSFPGLFRDVPGRTDKAVHDVDVRGRLPSSNTRTGFPLTRRKQLRMRYSTCSKLG